MGKALYRKYRSRSLDEVVGQEPITSTLKNALKQGKISHAYLFTGPRGVGKTSVARILAHEINDLPYEGDATHLDIIEIDAASNRRIDEIRDLRDKVHITPTSAKYKVYIIDEVHMLTKEAFNALLKTLEEPPAHVVFILATTEVHKLPETIISRVQRFSFQAAKPGDTVEHLRSIAKQEKIKISDDALELLALHGEGSFRDSVSLLDQAHSISDDVTLEAVQQLLGIAPTEALDSLVDTLGAGNPNQLIERLSELRNGGLQSTSIAKQLGETLRTQLLENRAMLGDTIVLKLLERLLAVPASIQPDRQLELVLLEVVLERHSKTTPATTPEHKPQKPVESIKQESETLENPTTPVKNVPFSIEAWPDILSELKKQHTTLYGVLRLSRPSLKDSSLVLAFSFPFHQKRMQDAANQQKLAAIIKQLTGSAVKIVAILDDTAIEPKELSKVDSHSSVSTISNIFGDAEVLD